MSEKDSNISQLVIVLTAICVVAALALGGVYEGTKERIAEEIRKAELAAVDAVLPKSDGVPEKEIQELPGKDYKGKDCMIKVYKATVAGKVTGTAFAVKEKGFGGEFAVMMGVAPDQKISGIEILLHKETPGLGAKIENDAFKNQFVGKSLLTSKLAVKKDGGEIDQITGATISSKAVTKAIKSGLEFYSKNLSPKEN